jgi:uncharacterized protein YaiI (UPF0178 family)
MPEASPTIWIDADAVPRAVREVCFQVAGRRGLDVVVVANRRQSVPDSPSVRLVTVSSAFDAADDHVVHHCARGDLVVTADLPLAARVVAKGALVLDHRGRVLDAENVQDSLALRDLAHDLRAEGVTTGGPAPFGRADRQRFVNALDRTLTSLLKSRA